MEIRNGGEGCHIKNKTERVMIRMIMTILLSRTVLGVRLVDDKSHSALEVLRGISSIEMATATMIIPTMTNSTRNDEEEGVSPTFCQHWT